MKRTLLFIFFMVFLVIPGVTFANWGGSAGDGSFGSGHLEAIGTQQIEILNEDLTIELYKDHAKVGITYIMRNTGDDVSVKAGFPNIIFGKKNEIHEYRIEIDDSKAKYKRIRGGAIKSIPVPDSAAMAAEFDGADNPLKISWFVTKVKFKQGEQKKIAISYRSRYQMSLGGVSDDTDYDAELFRYLLSTGATWKGPIRKGTITIKAISLDPESFTIRPANTFTRNKNVFTWAFENLEPSWKDNIIIDFNNAVSVKMSYNPDDTFGSSFYSFEKDMYYFAFHGSSAEASSTLKPADKYTAGNVFDMKTDTAWVEGKKGPGIGEYLLLKANKPIKVSQVGIIPGYAKSRVHYYSNNRVAQVTLVINKTYKVTSSIPDEHVSYDPWHPKAYHFIDISGYAGMVETIKLIIDGVHQGSKYDDTCISEILLRKQLKDKPQHVGAR